MLLNIATMPNLLILLLSIFLQGVYAQVICMGACGSDCSCAGNYTFQCKDKSCISIGKRSNGVIDCADESDENIECCSGHFKCDTVSRFGKCLPQSRINDGVKDCIDGTDEDWSNKKFCDLLEKRAGSGESLEDVAYTCKTQTSGSQVGKCIKWDWVLDGSEDCPLGDDEDATLQNECKLNRDDCHEFAICTNIVGGRFACECRQGYKGNGKTCTLDV